MSQKLRISKPGYNAITESDKRNLVFTSDLASLNYYAEGSVGVSGGSGVTVQTIAHNLGYIPFFTAFIGPLGVGGDTNDYCMCPFIFADFSNSFIGSVWADATNIYLSIDHDYPSTISVTFYYKIFRNSLGL